MSDKYIAYPAIFKATNDAQETYLVHFPDLPNTFTEGHGLEDSYVMAADVLAEMNWDRTQLPEPSKTTDIKVHKDEFIAVIVANLSAKKRELQ